MQIHFKPPFQTANNLSNNPQEINTYTDPSLIYGGTATSTDVTTNRPTDIQQSELPNELSKASTSQSNIWSTSLQTILDQPPSSLPYQIVLGGLAFCVSVIAWANFTHIDQVGKATGRLIPQGEVYKLHPVVSGKVSKVYVQEGQKVKAGDILVKLDEEIAINEVERLIQQLRAYQTQLSQTDTLIEKSRLEATTRVAINQAEVQGQEATIAQILAKMHSQEVALAQGLERLNINRSILNQLHTDAKAQQERLKRFESLVTQGAISQDQLFQVRQSLSDRQRSITQQNGEVQQNLAESQRLEIDLEQTDAELQRLEAELLQKQTQTRTIKLQSDQNIQKLQLEATELKSRIQQTNKQIQEARTRLKQRSLFAPVDGIILSLNVKNSGEVIQPEQIITELAPENAPLIIEAILPAQEAGFVKSGNTAKIKFDAYPYQDYGIISGTVISISPNSKQDQRFGTVYNLKISLERDYIKANNQTIKFQSGQTASAEIIIRKRRIIDIILEPIKQLQKSTETA